MSMYALSGVILSIFGVLLHQHFWAYCVGVCLLAWPSISMLVSVNVLYFEAMKDCAGASAEIRAATMATMAWPHGPAQGAIPKHWLLLQRLVNEN